MKALRNALLSLTVLVVISACNDSSNQTKITPQAQVDWAQGKIWYQIFPERFRNGQSANDPTVNSLEGSVDYPGWRVHPWTSDWYKMQPWEKRQSDKFYDVVYHRRYGGDLIGVIKKLDYLKELGIEGIYFNPLFEARSLHKYDGSSFHHIDDNFGPDPQGDKRRLREASETDKPDTWIWTSADSVFLELIKEAHKRNIKVVIDGVFNHTGRDFFAFRDILDKQQQSPYANWYTIKSWDDPKTEQNEFDYEAWWGFKSLPELKENDQGLVDGPRQYVMHATRRWLDPNGDGDPSDGIDGWRLDVAEEVAKPFWIEWNAMVKTINPKAITVAEIWSDASEWIEAGCFDGSMNYLWSKAAVRYFADQQRASSTGEFVEELRRINNLYGEETGHLLWNLLDSHDTERIASRIVNPDRQYDRNGSLIDNPNYKIRKPEKTERDVQKLITVFQLTYPGAPLIYYGTEAGMWGADDPDDRKPMLWSDMSYEPEATHPLKGFSRPQDVNKFDPSWFGFYKKMFEIRKQNPVLQTGNLRIIDDLLNDDIFMFSRQSENQQALVCFNRAEQEADLELPLSVFTQEHYRNALTDEMIAIDEKKPLFKLQANGFLMLISEK
ncbi:MAG: alpha-amylase [Caldithrix sp.]|nr:alpha-amylase [Caldithrix sp.]